MSPLHLLLVVLLVLLLLGSLPATGLHDYGYTPSGVVGILLVVFIILLLLGRI